MAKLKVLVARLQTESYVTSQGFIQKMMQAKAANVWLLKPVLSSMPVASSSTHTACR